MGRFVLISVIHIPYVFYHEAAIRAGLGKLPDLVPVFKPVKPSPSLEVPAYLVDPEFDGKVISLQAANQYTMVQTTGGEKLVRGTLAETIALLPDRVGIRTHRSYWVCLAELDGAHLIDKSKALRTVRGDTYPIGKTRLDAVAAAINR